MGVRRSSITDAHDLNSFLIAVRESPLIGPIKNFGESSFIFVVNKVEFWWVEGVWR